MLLVAMAASAQVDNPRGKNLSLQISNLQTSAQLPAKIDDICFLDNKLHFLSNDMLFAVSINNGQLGYPEIDTALTAIDQQMTYAVRHPSTGVLYFTKKDKKGDCFLYEYYEKKPGKYDTRRVKPYGFSYTVEHPVFSADGRAMVFASDCPIGFGQRDLWYSEWHNGQWQYPQNLGHRINSEGNETMPAIYGDFLVFSSSGRNDTYGGSDLYATRLVALEQTGDTVVMYPIGRSAVQSLEAPFCSTYDDFGFTFDGQGSGWWIERDALAGADRIIAFRGRLDCIRVSGNVSDVSGNILEGATVTYKTRDNYQNYVKTDAQGHFIFFVQPGEEYEVTCRATDHFSWTQPILFDRSKEDLLYINERYNIVLDAFILDSTYSYADLFPSPVATELSPAGRKIADRMVIFLTENPELRLSVTSAYNLSDDKTFCQLLNIARLKTLSDYLANKGISKQRLNTSDAKPADSSNPDSSVSDSSNKPDGNSILDNSRSGNKTALSSQTVSFIFLH